MEATAMQHDGPTKIISDEIIPGALRRSTWKGRGGGTGKGESPTRKRRTDSINRINKFSDGAVRDSARTRKCTREGEAEGEGEGGNSGIDAVSSIIN